MLGLLLGALAGCNSSSGSRTTLDLGPNDGVDVGVEWPPDPLADLCADGHWGVDCERSCSPTNERCLGPITCHRVTGEVISCGECAIGIFGAQCDEACVLERCIGATTCAITGLGAACDGVCESGWTGPACDQRDSDFDDVSDLEDLCPRDTNKTAPGDCGCGFREPSCSAVPVIAPIADVVSAPGGAVDVRFSVDDPDSFSEDMQVRIIEQDPQEYPLIAGTTLSPRHACAARTRVSLNWVMIRSTPRDDEDDLSDLEVSINGELRGIIAEIPTSGTGPEPLVLGLDTEGCHGTLLEIHERDVYSANEFVGLAWLGGASGAVGPQTVSIERAGWSMTFDYEIERAPVEFDARLEMWPAERVSEGGATFFVEVTEGGSRAVQKFNLSIGDVPKFMTAPPLFTQVPVGETLRLSCSATEGTIGWRLNGETLPQTGSPLIIEGFSENNAGVYSCTATNALGTVVPRYEDGTPMRSLVMANKTPTISGPGRVVGLRDQSVTFPLDLGDDLTAPGDLTVVSVTADSSILTPAGVRREPMPCPAPMAIEITAFSIFGGPDEWKGFEFSSPSSDYAVQLGYTEEVSLYPFIQVVGPQPMLRRDVVLDGPTLTSLITCDRFITVEKYNREFEVAESDRSEFDTSVGLGAGQDCREDSDCWSGYCDPTGCQPSPYPAPVYEYDYANYADGTRIVYLHTAKPHPRSQQTVRLQPAPGATGTTQVEMTVSDGVNQATHTFEYVVGDACDLPEAAPPGGSPVRQADCTDGLDGDDQRCTLRCPDGMVFAAAGTALEFGAETTARCENHASWVYEAPTLGCVDPNIALASVPDVTVRQGEVARVTIDISDLNTPAETATPNANGLDLRSNFEIEVSGDGWIVEPPCTLEREITITNAVALSAVDGALDDALEVELRLDGQTLTRMTGLTAGDSVTGPWKARVCGDGVVGVWEDDLDGPAADTFAADAAMGQLKIGRGAGQPCTEGRQCVSGQCSNARCDLGDAGRTFTETFASQTSAESVQLTYTVSVPSTHAVRLHKLTTADHVGTTEYSIRVSDGMSTAERAFDLTVLPTCDAPLGNTAGAVSAPELQIFPTTCADLVAGERCTSVCVNGATPSPAGAAGVEIECGDDQRWVTRREASLRCFVERSEAAPEGSISEDPTVAACDAFRYFTDLLPSGFPANWSGGKSGWIEASWHVGGEMGVYNRAGLAAHNAEAGERRVRRRESMDWRECELSAEGGSEALSCWTGSELRTIQPWERNPSCLEGGAHVYEDANATVSVFGKDIDFFRYFAGGQINGGRLGGCAESDARDGRSGARAQFDVYLRLGPKKFADVHRAFPSEDKGLMVGYDLSFDRQCKGIRVFGKSIEACAEATGEIGVEFTMLPYFDLPAQFGLALQATPKVQASAQASVNLLAVKLNLDVLLGKIELENTIDPSIRTGLCGSDAGGAKLALSGEGRLGITFPTGKLSAKINYLFGSSRRTLFTLESLAPYDKQLYSWEADLIDL